MRCPDEGRRVLAQPADGAFGHAEESPWREVVVEPEYFVLIINCMFYFSRLYQCFTSSRLNVSMLSKYSLLLMVCSSQ